MYAALVASLGIAILVLLLFVQWKYRNERYVQHLAKFIFFPTVQEEEPEVTPLPTLTLAPPPEPSPDQLVHQLSQKVEGLDLEEKDSLDDHLDALTKMLADKEGRLRLSKSKIRETQYEMDNLHAIDVDVRSKYREVMDSLKGDLVANERECKRLQEQIEWVSLKRAELHDEVTYGQKLYGEAAAELASNLSELQRGRTDYRVMERSITEKPIEPSWSSLRHRKEPSLPHMNGPVVIKSPPFSPRSATPTQSILRPPA